MVLDIHNSRDWRYEIKFILTQEDEPSFLDWVAGTPDFFRAYPTRQVNSVYLDSLDYDCAAANLGGFGWRSKYRFRWYGDQAQPKSTNFEIKTKRGRMGTKQTCPANIGSADPFNLSQTDLDKIFRHIAASEQIITPISHLRPVLFVGYERDYYQGANGIRVSLDRNLSFINLTDDHGFGARETYRDLRLILEFKFPSNQKDLVAEIMTALPFSATRSSKYMLGLAHAEKTVYF